jgi:hypothetical protein
LIFNHHTRFAVFAVNEGQSYKFVLFDAPTRRRYDLARRAALGDQPCAFRKSYPNVMVVSPDKIGMATTTSLYTRASPTQRHEVDATDSAAADRLGRAAEAARLSLRIYRRVRELLESLKRAYADGGNDCRAFVPGIFPMERRPGRALPFLVLHSALIAQRANKEATMQRKREIGSSAHIRAAYVRLGAEKAAA